jgi:hypothetical protein
MSGYARVREAHAFGSNCVASRRSLAVMILLLAMLVAAFFGRWIFWAGSAVFAVIGIADLFLADRPLD